MLGRVIYCRRKFPASILRVTCAICSVKNGMSWWPFLPVGPHNAEELGYTVIEENGKLFGIPNLTPTPL
jgi:hypothetical protein